jgi:hypothetical protein
MKMTMMTKRREGKEEKEAGAGGVDGSVLRAFGDDAADVEDGDHKYDEGDGEVAGNDDEGGWNADGRGGKPGAVT